MIPRKSVVLVVDKHSQDVHLAYCTAGVKYPVKYDAQSRSITYTKEFFSILADLANVQYGVDVFFYRRRIDEPSNARGFLGKWQAVGQPYEDLQTTLNFGSSAILGSCPNCGCPSSGLSEVSNAPICKSCKVVLSGHILPLRFKIAPIQIYPRYLDDNTAYIDLTDTGRLSTLIFRKIYGAGRERSVNPILPEEAEKLTRLLDRLKNKQENGLVPQPQTTLPTPTSPQLIDHYLDFSKHYLLGKDHLMFLYMEEGALVYETILEFWLVNTLAQKPRQILDLLGIPPREQIEWFSNQLLFGIGGEKSDVLILTWDEESLPCRAIVVELKKDAVNSSTLSQTKNYAYWIGQLVTAHSKVRRPFTITPVAIGHRTARSLQPFERYSFTIPYDQPLDVVVESPRVYAYSVDLATNTLQLTRVV